MVSSFASVISLCNASSRIDGTGGFIGEMRLRARSAAKS
jgi:hypothetical protein